MCGICGIYRFDKQAVTAEALKSMTNQMVHRGPDDEGMRLMGWVGLAMRRLSIIDLKSGHQPISNEDETIWVIMNGEIYNYVELRQELKHRGHQFRTSSDTEVIVHLYEDLGFEAVHWLNGMFSFALYDTRRDGLWIARDRIGIKPLFYAHLNESLYFASDLNALQMVLALGVDKEALLRYLSFSYIDSSCSIYAGIKKLPPAHWLWATNQGIQSRQYWKIEHLQTWKGSPQDAVNQLRYLIADSVRLQFRSDVPVGVFLSGGVDSSAVVAMASGVVSGHVGTFTIRFKDKFASDATFAQLVAARFRTQHKEFVFTSDDALAAFEELIPYLDEPIADSAIIPSYIIAREARQHGMKVMLTGAGGDELFGGYDRHWKPKFGSTSWFAEELPLAWKSIVAPALTLIDEAKGIAMRDMRLAYCTTISGVDLSLYKRLLIRRQDYDQMIDIIIHTFDDLVSRDGEKPWSYNRMYFDLKTYLVDDILALIDKSTMASSVEGRVPLLDHRLIEFAFALPQAINLLNGKPKGLLRRALSDLLPPQLLERRKEGFDAPMESWMMREFGEKARQELLIDPIEPFAELFDLKELQSVFDKRYLRRVAETLFNLYVFSRWHRSRAKTSKQAQGMALT